jgi:hypothetical protein
MVRAEVPDKPSQRDLRRSGLGFGCFRVCSRLYQNATRRTHALAALRLEAHRLIDFFHVALMLKRGFAEIRLADGVADADEQADSP